MKKTYSQGAVKVYEEHQFFSFEELLRILNTYLNEAQKIYWLVARIPYFFVLHIKTFNTAKLPNIYLATSFLPINTFNFYCIFRPLASE